MTMINPDRIHFGDDYVHIQYSCLIVRTKDMMEYIRYIKSDPRCPDCVYYRSDKSLLREWQAHNFLYYHNYEKARTMHVDLNDEPTLRRIGYALLSLLYRIGI